MTRYPFAILRTVAPPAVAAAVLGFLLLPATVLAQGASRAPGPDGSDPAPAAESVQVAATLFAGWQRVLTSTSYADRYIPAVLLDAIERGEEVPAVVFLHGAGTAPGPYKNLIGPAAEEAGAVLILPNSLGQGWEVAGDLAVVTESLQRVGEELPLDPLRTSVAGHSAGGAYAPILTYREGVPFSAVFTVSAPFAPVDQLAPGSGATPIRMDYGSQDQNFTGGSAARMGEQWDRLGVPWEQRVHAGLDHEHVVTAANLADGFVFLVAQTLSAERCLPSDTAHCLQNGRFRVELTWQTPAGAVGVGHVVPGTSSVDSGLFWFFRPENWELLIKVLDGCPVNDHFWVFAAATTNVGHTITVTDTATGAVWTHQNPVGQSAPAVTATEAFATCE